MSERDNSKADENQDVHLWEPSRALRRVSRIDAGLSRGFLRCRPERWFPGFAGHWLPVIHALGVEARISEIRPVLARPPVGDLAYVAMVGGEPIVVAMESSVAHALSEEVVAGAGEKASSVVLEYLCRRLVSTLALSWSGAESTSVDFLRDGDPEEVDVVGSIKLAVTVNTLPVTVWIGLGTKLVETFDGLWRKQVRTMAKVSQEPTTMRLEIAQLGVPPQMLADYLTKGTVIDLEVNATENVTLKIGHKAWMPAKLVDVGGSLGCEMAPGALVVPQIAEGATHVSVEFGSVEIEGGGIAELSQAGAIVVTDIPVSERVQLVINQERVASARLCVYEGRFAIEVI